MTIRYYSQRKPSSELIYKRKPRRRHVSSKTNFKRLTVKNRQFLRSLGFKVLH